MDLIFSSGYLRQLKYFVCNAEVWQRKGGSITSKPQLQRFSEQPSDQLSVIARRKLQKSDL